ncbi:MAG TPA: hypothetical protein VFK05_17655 [Polyangiaceae bacterium]|nr:hypothetical protein [Polyangiaceae bacterium]
MLRAFSLKSKMFWALTLGGCLAASCDERGVTSSCPPLPLYQTYPLGDASPADAASPDSAEVQLALEVAYDAGCATRPTQFPYDAAAGAGGSSGSTGNHAGAAGQH